MVTRFYCIDLILRHDKRKTWARRQYDQIRKNLIKLRAVHMNYIKWANH